MLSQHDADRSILVTGATGRQGGATARYLLAAGFRVFALTRRPDGPAAQRLAQQGAEVVSGDLEDPASLRRAMEGMHGVFSVQNYWEKGVGRAGEVRQARNIVAAAKSAGVRHLVQASISRCDAAPGVDHFASKHEVERLVDAEGVPRTFLRAVFFMDNFLDPKYGAWLLPILAGALRPGLGLHMIATDDVGAFAADVFARPDDYLGRTLDIAGDIATVDQMRAALARARRPAPRYRIPAWVTRLMSAEFARQFAWNNEVGWDVDVAAVRRLRPQTQTLLEYLARHQSGTAAASSIPVAAR